MPLPVRVYLSQYHGTEVESLPMKNFTHILSFIRIIRTRYDLDRGFFSLEI